MLQSDPTIGKEIDGHRVLSVLGRGGMGIVYKAEDLALGREVALKMIDPGLARDEAFLRRFRSEARALARIDDPHIVRIYALRQTDAGVFIVMEYVEGGTLGDVLEHGPMAWDDAYPIIRQMLQAFEYAHALGIIHRDIKPGNIMLTPERQVKVTDFGLAKMTQTDAMATVTKGVAGTLYYMSPEQVKGLEDLDHRTDLYALGMTIYQMLAGQVPFDRSQGEFTIMRRIVEEPLPPPSTFRPDLPEPLVAMVMKALEKDPDDRYQNASEMLAAFDAFAEGRPTPAAVPTAAGDGTVVLPHLPAFDAPAAPVPAKRRSKALPLAAAALAVLVVLSGGGYLWYQQMAATVPGPVQPGATAAWTIATTPPGARVSLDGTALAGETPLRSFAVAEGTHRLVVERAGYARLDTTLTAEAGTARTLTLPLTALAGAPAATDTAGDDAPDEPRRVGDDAPRGTVTPPAAASTDARTPDAGPATVAMTISIADRQGAVRVGSVTRNGGGTFALTPGTHTVTFTRGGASFDVPVEVTAGGATNLVYHLARQLSVNTRPAPGGPRGRPAPSAAIWVDGRPLDDGAGHAVFTPREIVLEMGTHTVHVQKDGFVVDTPEQTVTVTPSLDAKMPSNLLFVIRPEGGPPPGNRPPGNRPQGNTP